MVFKEVGWQFAFNDGLQPFSLHQLGAGTEKSLDICLPGSL